MGLREGGLQSIVTADAIANERCLDFAIRVDDELSRERADMVESLSEAFAVDAGRVERKAEGIELWVLRQPGLIHRVCIPDADRQHYDVLVSSLSGKGVQPRKSLHAGGAPGRPEVQNHPFPAQVREFHGTALRVLVMSPSLHMDDITAGTVARCFGAQRD